MRVDSLPRERLIIHLWYFSIEQIEIVPTRGIVHDIVRVMANKKIILELYRKGYQTPEIARMTNHTEQACDRLY